MNYEEFKQRKDTERAKKMHEAQMKANYYWNLGFFMANPVAYCAFKKPTTYKPEKWPQSAAFREAVKAIMEAK